VAGGTTGCLTADQVAAVKKVFAGPTTSKGEKIYTGGPMAGSELTTGTAQPRSDPRGGGNRGTTSITGAYVNLAVRRISAWPSEYFRYVGFMPHRVRRGNIRVFDFRSRLQTLGDVRGPLVMRTTRSRSSPARVASSFCIKGGGSGRTFHPMPRTLRDGRQSHGRA